MGDSAGIGGGVGNREISHQPEPMQTYPYTTLAGQPGVEAGFTSLSESASDPGPAQPPPPQLGKNAPQPGRNAAPHIPRWLVRGELILRTALRIYIGLAVCYAPWSSNFWDRNPLFAAFPTLAIFAANGAVRGIVSGLGLLNLWIALHDTIRYREDKP